MDIFLDVGLWFVVSTAITWMILTVIEG